MEIKEGGKERIKGGEKKRSRECGRKKKERKKEEGKKGEGVGKLLRQFSYQH